MIEARYLLVDVFTTEPLAGNALAVFPDASVPDELMQPIAREMNLSETTFVRRVEGATYDVRIFTPFYEMPFAGHPTLGTAWTLRYIGALSGGEVSQRSPAGDTPVRFTDDLVWLERRGSVGDRPEPAGVAAALGMDEASIGFDAVALGLRPARLLPAVANAGVSQVIVPIASVDALRAVRPRATEQARAHDGVYCVAATGHGALTARFFDGAYEDPATGSAAAALGLYLADSVGECAFTISQGEQVRRPSTIHVRARAGAVAVGGSVRLVGEGTLRL